MQTSKNHFEAKVIFNDETIRRMFRTEFYTYEGMQRLVWLAVAFALVMLALFVPIPTVVKVLCLLVGCAMFAMPDFLSRVAAEGVIMQRGGAESTVSCRINAGGVDVENGAHIPFEKIDRLVEDDQYFYLFQSRQMAVMIPKGSPLLEAAVREHPELPAQERGNLLGECDLILSFLMYNDITRMSRLHRSASRQMTRPAVTLRNSGSWTFGSPSVLMMYYRAPGELGKELAEMYECMPHYYKITQGHGQGAELVMDAEAAFMQGHFERAVLLLERARVRAASCGQENMALCCDFLALRLSLCGQAGEPFDFEARRAALLQRHDAVLLHLLESIEAYYYALLGRTDAVPEVFREHRLASVSYFALCRPMMEMIELQVWLAQGQAVKVLARCEELLAACQRFHYGLVALHVRVQMAAAYGLYGQPAEARAALEQALAEAAPDGFWMPLAENYRYLAPLLAQGGWGSAQPLVERAIALGQRYEARRAQLNGSADRPAIAAALTEKELALARLVAQRRTNKEIAETLHLSEGTVKQYINQLYAKLDIGGAVRNKRAQLAALFGTKY